MLPLPPSAFFSFRAVCTRFTQIPFPRQFLVKVVQPPHTLLPHQVVWIQHCTKKCKAETELKPYFHSYSRLLCWVNQQQSWMEPGWSCFCSGVCSWLLYLFNKHEILQFSGLVKSFSLWILLFYSKPPIPLCWSWAASHPLLKQRAELSIYTSTASDMLNDVDGCTTHSSCEGWKSEVQRHWRHKRSDNRKESEWKATWTHLPRATEMRNDSNRENNIKMSEIYK